MKTTVSMRPIFILAACATPATTVLAQDCYSWIEGTLAPGPPAFPSMIAFDSNRNVLVVMGEDLFPETWEWNGSTWTLKSTSTPQFGSTDSSAVFDDTRGVVLVFSGSPIGETWQWNGVSWVLRSQSGPGPRRNFAMDFDSSRGVAVLHGGRDLNNSQIVFNDTWEWDGSVWMLKSTAGPMRRAHVMAFDSARNVSVLHGGRDAATTIKKETWEWDGTNWMLVASDDGPAVAEDYTMNFDTIRSVMVLFYKTGASDWYEEWIWDGLAWTSSLAPGSRAFYGSRQAFDSIRGVTLAYAYGLWEWDGLHWTLLCNGYPVPYSFAASLSMAYDRAKNYPIAAEGLGGITRIWAQEADQWSIIDSNGPSAGQDPAIAYDEARNVLVLFGGSDRSTTPETYFGATWEWDGVTWTQRATSGPSPRGRHSMAYDASRGVVVMFGGWNGTTLGDTWEWNGSDWSLRSATGPSARFWYGLAYDRMRQVTVLAGGGSKNGPFTIGQSGTWEWDGQNWAQRSGNQPPARYLPAFLYDEARNVSVIVGGYQIGPADFPVYVPGTREWDGTTWTLRTTEGTLFGTGVYDVLHSKSFVMSGPTIWEYFHDLPVVNQPLAELFDSGSGAVPAIKNRYISFTPPEIPTGASGIAFRVTVDQLPGATNCPNIPDFSDRFQAPMWVGDEVLQGGTGTGIFKLSSTPVLRDWSTVPGSVIHVADCNIVPCASYAVEAASDIPCSAGVPTVFSEPTPISTSSVWGDVAGNTVSRLPDGIVDFFDISESVDRFKNQPSALPSTWCDLGGDSPTQGVNFSIDFSDISLVVDAFKGSSYPFPGPTAPNSCP